MASGAAPLKGTITKQQLLLKLALSAWTCGAAFRGRASLLSLIKRCWPGEVWSESNTGGELRIRQELLLMCGSILDGSQDGKQPAIRYQFRAYWVFGFIWRVEKWQFVQRPNKIWIMKLWVVAQSGLSGAKVQRVLCWMHPAESRLSLTGNVSERLFISSHIYNTVYFTNITCILQT